MSEVKVDSEKLIYGLEKGIGYTDFGNLPKEYRLRNSPCGLVSSALDVWCKQYAVPSQQMISRPNFDFDPGLEHVFPLIGEAGGDCTIVDAAYSQFLGYVGITSAYDERVGGKAYPRGKLLHFKQSETEIYVNLLTFYAVHLRNFKSATESQDSGFAYRGRLEDAPPEVVRGAYSRIWNPANTNLHIPTKRVVEHGGVVAKYIPKGAIAIY